jgi:hypothetical protein
MSARRGYEIVLYLGSARPELQGVAALVEIRPSSPSLDNIIDAIRESGITPADLRARTLFLADEFADRDITAALYAALVGFAGRRLDFSTGAEPINAAVLHAAGSGAEDAGKPDELPESVQVGPSAGSIDPTRALTLDDITTLRYARRAVLQPMGSGVAAALTQVVMTAALRVRNGADYFPHFTTTGDEPVDLDTLRRAGSELRRSIRTDARDAIAPALTPGDRQIRLSQAAEVSMEQALVRLGSFQAEDTGFWRCTRPSRHRNGDANPSMRVTDGKVRCFRCDTEMIDPLRLTIDTLDLAPDAAADYLLQN